MSLGPNHDEPVQWVLLGGPFAGTVLETPASLDQVRLADHGTWVSYRAHTFVLGQWSYRVGLHPELTLGPALDLHAAEVLRASRLRPTGLSPSGWRPGG
jgi:hypothetical protein